MAFHATITGLVPVGLALLLLRLILSAIFLVHGSRKLMKKESDGSAKYLFLGTLEVVGGIMVLVGLWTWIPALLFIVIMLGAVFLKSFVWPDQKWAGSIEYDVLIMMAALTILALGPGMLAIS